MKLTYTTEKSEKETIRLFRRLHGGVALVQTIIAGLTVLGLIAAFLLHFEIVVDNPGTGVLCALAGVAFLGCLSVFLLDRFLVGAPRKAYRTRSSHRVDYSLTDEGIAVTIGGETFSAPWLRAARAFKLDRKALYLFGKDLPLEARVIPDWRGRGVSRRELVASLKKAGLKKVMKKRWKILIGFVSTPIVLMVALAIYFHIGSIEWRDWTIPNEAELRLDVREIPDEDNAYVMLQSLTNICAFVTNYWGYCDSSDVQVGPFVGYYSNPFGVGCEESHEAWAAVRTNPGSVDEANKILADHAEFFKAFDNVLQTSKEYSDIQDYKRLFRPDWGFLPLYFPFRDYAKLLALKTQIALETSDIGTAADCIERIYSLGQMMTANSGVCAGCLIGDVIKDISYKKMCDFVAMDKASDEIIERFAELLDADAASAPMRRERKIKARFEGLVTEVEWFGKATIDSIADSFFTFFRSGFFFRNRFYEERRFTFPAAVVYRSGYVGFCVHPRETLFKAAAVARAALSNEELALSEDSLMFSFVPNCFGDLIAGWTWSEFLEAYVKDDSFNRLRARLILAAAKWRRAHGGANPPTLDALVPDSLAAVPADPWAKDGRPVQYDAATGVCWSIGGKGDYDYPTARPRIATADKSDPVRSATHRYAFRLDGRALDIPDPE